MSFSFGNINVNARKNTIGLTRLDNPVLVDKSNAPATYERPVAVLVERPISKIPPEGKTISEMDIFESYLQANGITRYKIIYVLNTDIKGAERLVDKTGKTKFYRANRAKFDQYLDKWCSVITFGPALYAMLMEDDIYPNHVQQYIFGVTHFLFSRDLSWENYHRIYPFESIDDLFPVGDYRGKHYNFWESPRIHNPNRKDKSFIFNYATSEMRLKLRSKKQPILLPADSFRSKIAYHQFKEVLKEVDDPIPEPPKLNKIFIYSQEDFHNLFYMPNKDKHAYVAWDLETSGLDFMTDEIGCITLSFDGITGYYIPWKYVIKEELDEIFKNNKNIGANLKFDYKHVKKAGLNNAHIDEDIIILGHILEENRSNSLKSLAFYYSEFGGYERALDEYKAKCKIETYMDIPDEILRDYAVMDAIVTYRVWVNELKHLRQLDAEYPNEFGPDNMESYYYDRRIPAVNMYANIEYRGLYIDKAKLDDLRKVMQDYIHNLEDELCDDLKIPRGFEFSSIPKLGIMIEEHGWEDLGRNLSGNYQVSDFQLERWAKTHEEAKKLQLLKSLYTLLNGFVGDDAGLHGWPQYMVQHEDGSWRIHANYQAMFTDSGRTKCNSPNFQNIPTRGMFSQEIKGCITSPNNDEYDIVTIDYSALQGRLCTQDSADENLTSVFNVAGADFHSKTAFLTFFANKEIDVEVITVEQDGKTYKFLGGEQVMTQRGEVFAHDLTEADTIIEE